MSRGCRDRKSLIRLDILLLPSKLPTGIVEGLAEQPDYRQVDKRDMYEILFGLDLELSDILKNSCSKVRLV
jgi:hypothetical protein